MAEPEPQTADAGAAAAWHWAPEHWEARAARVKMNAEGGLEWPLQCEDMPDKNPSEDLSDPYIDNFLAASCKDFGLEGLLMIVTRTDNSNTVVYKVRRRLSRWVRKCCQPNGFQRLACCVPP